MSVKMLKHNSVPASLVMRNFQDGLCNETSNRSRCKPKENARKYCSLPDMRRINGRDYKYCSLPDMRRINGRDQNFCKALPQGGAFIL